MFSSTLIYCLLPLLAVAQDATQTGTERTPTEVPNPGYNGGEDNPVDPSDAGAAGTSKGAFTLSSGGLAAIITVAVVVAVLGIASAVLFWLAKKRQWDVRQSLRRASRRLTGRSTSDAAVKRQNRRTGVRLNSPPAPNSRRERDVEKGLPVSGQQGKTTTTITSTFDVDTPTPKSGWKPSVLGKK
ncbi:hypothetical protein CC78DRAFT_548258 [Lojkania enalia]|uniref:Transmembrane protein n=1 Tax=Lojkania enalia TaxID=147567 RepID=A0A9P4N281_9PLEO|nr:hypothetical protein CC78DRAFT_548258 [Didymosphaeria enalia]